MIGGLRRYREEILRNDYSLEHFLNMKSTLILSSNLNSQNDETFAIFLKEVSDDLKLIHGQTLIEIEKSMQKVYNYLPIINTTIFHQIFVQCKIKIDEAEYMWPHPVLQDMFYPSIIDQYMRPLIPQL